MIEENKQLSILASKDGLTGILNRRAFLNCSGYFIDNCKKENVSLACLFIDLDGFKQVNDTLGHNMGDLVLKATADKINSLLTTQDLVARIGGDEFAVMTKFNQIEEIIDFSEKIKNSISQIKNINGSEINISASIGVTIYERGMLNTFNEYDLLRYADDAMYCVKKNGKAQVYACRPGESAHEIHQFVQLTPS